MKRECNIGLSHCHCIVGRVYTEHFLTLNVLYLLVETRVVMTKHDDIEAWYLLSYSATRIFLVFTCCDSAFTSTVE